MCTDRVAWGGEEAEGEEETAASNSTLAISAARAAWRRSEARPAPYVLRLMYDDSHVSLTKFDKLSDASIESGIG